MTRTVGDFVARRLHEWGVQRSFGYPWDGINGITAGLPAAGEGLRPIAGKRES